MKPVIKKFTVAGLLCLFVWNVALAGVPGFLLCLHEDFLLHFQSEDTCETHCEEGHADEEPEDAGFCDLEGDCTDLELVGGVEISTRANEIETIDLPALSLMAFNYPLTPSQIFKESAQFRPPLRGPPSVHWLTDHYIQKTVLRV
jgi:hypothetical protein